ncbi:MAG TPA: 50S ribosomal protein L23 [Chloroflexota bacterium]|nr:50S ribosomal protein L23 [Chloroflexota bacterium]
MEMWQVIVRPLITEKNTNQVAEGKYTFEVARGANKIQIREAVEKIFKVDVTAVNVINVRGKERGIGRNKGMASNWRKAVVTLKEGQRIEDLYEGV